MKKISILIIILFVFQIGLLSGCITNNNSEENNDLQDTTPNYEELENSFLSLVRSIGSEFRNQNDVLNYNNSQFVQHQTELNNLDISPLDTHGEYAGSYTQLRTYLIKGLQYIINKDYENAWKNILYASSELFDINTYTGDMWEIDVGLENLKDILYDLK